MSPTTTAAGKPPKRKPPVRRDPERRRQQNIEAQKRYREKLRQRIGNLEAIAASVAQSHVAPEVTTGPSEQTSTETSHVASESLLSSEGSETPPSLFSLSTVYPEVPEEGSQWAIIPHSDENRPSLGSWDSIVHLDPCLLVGHSPEREAGLVWMPASGCGCTGTNDGLQRIVSHRSGAAKLFSDPYANHLRLETVCTLDAMFSLGTLLGIPADRMCPKETPSPFFRSGNASVDAISTVQQIFRTLKPDLRPSREQVTVAHHPFIDCLPFPTLRKNLLARQGQVDAEQLQFDVIEGLVCWGGAGVSKRDRKDCTGYASTGTPWDVRSWEAKEFFLRKYWAMLGGEEGELVRQSEWWRDIRGEEPLRIELMS
ncbi:hypothetical protein PG990_009409 [Apiospora arundinis]